MALGGAVALGRWSLGGVGHCRLGPVLRSPDRDGATSAEGQDRAAFACAPRSADKGGAGRRELQMAEVTLVVGFDLVSLFVLGGSSGALSGVVCTVVACTAALLHLRVIARVAVVLHTLQVCSGGLWCMLFPVVGYATVY